jgi:hypothetical protein
MLALGLLLSLAPAQAQDLVPSYTGEHTWKLEAYLQEMGVPESPNVKVAAVEAWSAKVTCKPTSPRSDSCTFQDGKIYWGWVPGSGGELKVFPVDAPVTLDVTYTPTGRIASWDTNGDRMTLQQNLALAFFDRHAGGWRVDSPNFRRQIGQELEQKAFTYLLAALDVELPKKGQDNGQPWRFAALPGAMKRGQGGMGGNKVELKVDNANPGPEGTLAIDVKGDGSVTYAAGADLALPIASASEQTFTTRMIGRILVDRADGRVAAADLWTTTGSALPIYGFKTLNLKATKWSDDLKPEPGPVPKIPWKN